MAQATRTTPATADLSSDDPMEAASDWLTANARSVTIVVAAVAVLGAGIFGYRYLNASKLEQASTALYQAQGPMLEGKMPEAQVALQRVATKYGGTTAGQQAMLLLAQVMYEQKQYQQGISMLEKGRGDASKDVKASFDAMAAAGYEGLRQFDKAADSYGKAAEAAVFKQERGQYRASQARSLMSAGKMDAARTIWQELSAEEDSPFGQEARVRLGEIAGMAAAKK